MSLITWNKKQFSVDVDEMNEQHKKWIALINKLHESLINQDSGISPETAIKEMINYTKFHFKEEEALLQEVKFPNYDKHKLEHEYFVLKLEKLDQDIEIGANVLRTQIMSILKNWLEDHICKVDKSYGIFIYKNRINQ